MSFVSSRMNFGGMAPRWFQDKSRQVGPLVVGLTAVLGLAVAGLRGAEAYRAPHDKIMGSGDSIPARKAYKPNQFTGAWLTSVPLVGVDWTDFFRLSAGADDVFYRVGY